MDMALSQEQKKDFSTPSVMEAPRYPYGLRITLSHEELQKLGFQKAPEIDTQYMIAGAAKVVEVRSDGEDEAGYTLELQIIDLEVKTAKTKGEDTTKVLYGEA